MSLGWGRSVSITDFLGMTFDIVEKHQDIEVYFRSGPRLFLLSPYKIWKSQSRIDDVAGDFEDLVGAPLLSAYEEISEVVSPYKFYRLTTVKGTVVIRWHLVGNERVELYEVKKN